jgi:uncharacterized membrane protein
VALRYFTRQKKPQSISKNNQVQIFIQTSSSRFMAFELIVFFTALKYVFVEGGEQALVGIGVLSRVGLRQTLKITLFGIAVGVVLYFVFLNVAGIVPTDILEIALGAGLLFFSATMFKEFFEEEQLIDDTKFVAGYIYIAILEAIENSIAMATFSIIELTSAVLGAIIAILIIVSLIWIGIIKRVPMKITRLVAGILLASTGIPLILYGLNVPVSEVFYWLVPPLQ